MSTLETILLIAQLASTLPLVGLIWTIQLVHYPLFELVAIIWVSTALIQVPCHNRLVDGFHQPSHRRLVDSNWIRTIAWSLRGGVVVVMAGIGF